MEHGDIVLYENDCYVILQVGEKHLYCLAYDFTTSWLDVSKCQKVGTSYALFKVMYDMKSYEIKTATNDKKVNSQPIIIEGEKYD